MPTEKELLNQTLYKAVRDRDVNRVRAALSAGADPGYIEEGDSERRYTALHCAANNADVEIARILVEAGAPLSAPDKYGKTPLEIAIQFGKDEAFSVWLAQRTGIAVHRAKGALALAAERSQEKLMDVLIVLGCTNSSTGTIGANALISAAWAGSVVGVRKMLALGADIESVTKYGETALHVAVSRGEEAVVEVLLAAGANPNATQTANQTPLLYAASRDSDDIVRRLLEAGADVGICDFAGTTPYQHAIDRGAVRVLEQLQAKGFSEPMDQEGLNRALAQVAKNGHAAMASKLIDMGADPHFRPNGKTLLQYARSDAAAVKEVILAARSAGVIGRAVESAPDSSAPKRRAPRMSPI